MLLFIMYYKKKELIIIVQKKEHLIRAILVVLLKWQKINLKQRKKFEKSLLIKKINKFKSKTVVLFRDHKKNLKI